MFIGTAHKIKSSRLSEPVAPDSPGRNVMTLQVSLTLRSFLQNRFFPRERH
jgi:hypothetical protein